MINLLKFYWPMGTKIKNEPVTESNKKNNHAEKTANRIKQESWVQTK